MRPSARRHENRNVLGHLPLSFVLASLAASAPESGLAAQTLAYALDEANCAAAKAAGIPLTLDSTTDLERFPPVDRGILDFLVLARAFREGCKDSYRVTAVEIPNVARARAEAALGKIDLYVTWSGSGGEKADRSLPYVKNGMLDKGLYTHRANTKVLAARTAQAIHALSAGTVASWEVDKAVLKRMGVARIEYASTKSSLFAMLAHGRFDFTLASFSSKPDMSIEFEGRVFLPIEGFRVNLKDSMHFFISRLTKNSGDVLRCLNAGLEKLHSDKSIERLFLMNGIVHPQGSTWTNVGE